MSTHDATPRQWTDAQRRAIEHLHGDLLVSAAAGSGKTAVLAERCARLVCGESGERCGVDQLLVVTFTDAAANEMRSRIAAAIREKTRAAPSPDGARWLRRQAAMVDRAGISTLHAFCVRILRQFFHEAHIDPAFEVMDQEEAALLQEEVLDQLLIRWHDATSEDTDAICGERFGTFFEAYAYGRERTCRQLVLNLHRMLATTADPEAFLTRARSLYAKGKNGCQQTIDDFGKHVFDGKLRIEQLHVRRCREDAVRLGLDQIRDRLDQAMDQLTAARAMLARGSAGWSEACESLKPAWKNVDTLRNVPDFENLKDRLWQSVKDNFKKLRETFNCDTAPLLQELESLAEPLETLICLTHEFQQAFTAAKRAQNRVDFNDLERIALDLLKKTGSLAAAELRNRFRHVLVDEFQDINPLQAEILEKIRRPDRAGTRAGNLFVVGDVKQSIYAFRLADAELFIEKERRAREQDSAFVALPHNFRSHSALLHVMNALFERLLTAEVARVHYADGHALQSGATTPPSQPPALNGTPVEFHLAIDPDDVADSSDWKKDDDEKADSVDEDAAKKPRELLSGIEREARIVARRIAGLLRENRTVTQKDGSTTPLEPRHIAILLRKVKNNALIFAQALWREGVPYHADLSTGYFDTREVADALALLHVLDNPQQDIPLATALLGPYGDFLHDDIALIRLSYDRQEVSFAEAVARYAAGSEENCITRERTGEGPAFSQPLKETLAAFFGKLKRWRELLQGRPLHEGLAQIFAESHIFARLAGMESGSQRIANLQTLHQRALKFSTFRLQGLHRFLRYIERLAEDGGDYGEAPVLSEASNVVRIMSVHKSKGLEFPVVCVGGLGGQFNFMEPAGGILIHRDIGVGMPMHDVERNVTYPSIACRRIKYALERHIRAEELRILYVAMTRARDLLILSGHLRKGEELADVRAEWGGHAGPLPEDRLMTGRRPVDWLLPACAAAEKSPLSICWESSAYRDEQLLICTHGEVETSPETPAQAAANPLDCLTENADENDPALAAILHRITGKYDHQSATERAAVQSVTMLKSAAVAADTPAEQLIAESPPDAAEEAASETTDQTDLEARIAESRLRGTSTHRVLELLDLAQYVADHDLDRQVQQLVESKRLSKLETEKANLPGIRWFLESSESGRRVLSLAPDKNWKICREIPFIWLSPLPDSNATDPADRPTIRGVIDLLLVNETTKTAEILDYKTDSKFLWKARLEAYRTQMRYYLRAAGDILGFPVTRSTLIFLSPREEVAVDRSAG